LRDTQWIDRTEALDRALAQLPDGPLAFDLEADSFHHYRDQVCLVQLTWGQRTLLVDTLAGVSLAPLRAPLADPRRPILIHGADYDLRLLQRDHALSVRGLFDTMVAARLVGEPAFGLAALLDKHLGVSLDKTHQRADWSLRPLPAAMVEYAAADTRHLGELASLLERRLEELGRSWWAREEFERLEAMRWSPGPDDPEGWRKVKGSSGLDRLGLAVLRELVGERDSLARARDVPPFRVVRDEVLIELSRRRPVTREDLAAVPGIPRGIARAGTGERFLEAMGRGQALAPEDRPELRRSVRERPSAEFEARVKRLRDARDGIAAELSLEPSLLAPRAVLEGIAARQEAGEDPAGGAELRRWQRQVLAPLLVFREPDAYHAPGGSS
jgi:ribonuclease D